MSTSYFSDGGAREWNESCDPMGIDLLLKWIARNKDAVKRISVEYDPAQIVPDEVHFYVVGGDCDEQEG